LYRCLRESCRLSWHQRSEGEFSPSIPQSYIPSQDSRWNGCDPDWSELAITSLNKLDMQRKPIHSMLPLRTREFRTFWPTGSFGSTRRNWQSALASFAYKIPTPRSFDLLICITLDFMAAFQHESLYAQTWPTSSGHHIELLRCWAIARQDFRYQNARLRSVWACLRGVSKCQLISKECWYDTNWLVDLSGHPRTCVLSWPGCRFKLGPRASRRVTQSSQLLNSISSSRSGVIWRVMIGLGPSSTFSEQLTRHLVRPKEHPKQHHDVQWHEFSQNAQQERTDRW